MDKKKQEEYHFVKEHIKKIPPDRKKRRMSLGWTILLAAVFGVVAALVFCAVKPAIERLFQSENEQVVLSSDETKEADTADEPVYITETQQMDLNDYQILQNKLYAVGREANKSVVSVKGIGQTTDWFDTEHVMENQGSGIILADTNGRYLIATERKLIAEANQIEVSFYDDSTAEAELIAYDGTTGIAVLSVQKSQVSEDTQNRVAAATLGSSSALTQGTIVIAIGSPLGEPFSVLTGNVTSSSHEVTATDANYKVISTDINAGSGGSGALINLNGEVVGLILQSFGTEAAQSTVTAIGITEIRSMLEKMSNGDTPAYLGLEVRTVSRTIAKENKIPQAVVADIAQSDAITSGSNREGMFYAARTFAFKLGQSLSMLIFTAVSTIGAGNGTGYRVAAFGAAVFCCVGGIILAFYNEKRINGIISGK